MFCYNNCLLLTKGYGLKLLDAFLVFKLVITPFIETNNYTGSVAPVTLSQQRYTKFNYEKLL